MPVYYVEFLFSADCLPFFKFVLHWEMQIYVSDTFNRMKGCALVFGSHWHECVSRMEDVSYPCVTDVLIVMGDSVHCHRLYYSITVLQPCRFLLQLCYGFGCASWIYLYEGMMIARWGAVLRVVDVSGILSLDWVGRLPVCTVVCMCISNRGVASEERLKGK
jgi:hypothetical protein